MAYTRNPNDWCSECGEYKLGPFHKCKPSWLCLNDNEGQPTIERLIDEGTRIYANSEEKAVEKYCESYDSAQASYQEDRKVYLIPHRYSIDPGEKVTVKQYEVLLESVPSYTANHEQDLELVGEADPDPEPGLLPEEEVQNA